MTAWMDRGACRGEDPSVFFPEGESAAFEPQVNSAKKVCFTCPVRMQCMNYAIEHNLVGVWGGTTDTERKNERRRRQRYAARAV